jgi:hypothetical protein
MAGGVAQSLDSPGVFGVRSVREIQPRNVHARAHQVANHFFGIAGRTNRADDFCAAHTLGHFQRSSGSRQISFNQIRFAFFQVANPLSIKCRKSSFLSKAIPKAGL